MEGDLPPPYTPRDPLTPSSSTFSSQDHELPSASLRGGYLRGVHYHEDSTMAEFFDERAFDFQAELSLVVLDREITPNTTRENLVFPAEIGEHRDVTTQDWQTFVNYVLTELGTEASREKQRRQKMTSEEFEAAQHAIEGLVAEWNEGFFRPRSIQFVPKYKFELETSPGDVATSSTAATRDLQNNVVNDVGAATTATPIMLPAFPHSTGPAQSLPFFAPPHQQHMPPMPSSLPAPHGISIPSQPSQPSQPYGSSPFALLGRGMQMFGQDMRGAGGPRHEWGPGPGRGWGAGQWGGWGAGQGAGWGPGHGWAPGHGGHHHGWQGSYNRGGGCGRRDRRWQDQRHGFGQRSDHHGFEGRRRRSSSVSSSSSSSASSISSVDTDDFQGQDMDHLRAAMMSMKMDSANRKDVKQGIRQLRQDMRTAKAQLRHSPNIQKSELKARKKEIKGETKAMMKEIKSRRKAEKRQLKAERRSLKAQEKAHRRDGNGPGPHEPVFFQPPSYHHDGNHSGQTRGVFDVPNNPNEQYPNDKGDAAHFKEQQEAAFARQATANSYQSGESFESPDGESGLMSREEFITFLQKHMKKSPKELEKIARDTERKAEQYEKETERLEKYRERDQANWSKQIEHWTNHYEKMPKHNDSLERAAQRYEEKIVDWKRRAAESQRAKEAKTQKQAHKAQRTRQQTQILYDYIRGDIPPEVLNECSRGLAEGSNRPGEAYGSKMESYFEEMGRNIEMWGERFGRSMEQLGEEIERRAEEKGKMIDRKFNG